MPEAPLSSTKGSRAGSRRGSSVAAVVVGLEVDRAFVDLVQHQPGDGRQARFGVAHGGGAVAVAAAEVALAVDQRVALRKVLRHAHHRVVGRGVAVRVVLAQHVAHHARALHRLGAAVPLKARPMRNIEYRMRRCTGLLPSHTSGRARPLTTDSAYSR
jgi:hypothetical protein